MLFDIMRRIRDERKTLDSRKKMLVALKKMKLKEFNRFNTTMNVYSYAEIDAFIDEFDVAQAFAHELAASRGWEMKKEFNEYSGGLIFQTRPLDWLRVKLRVESLPPNCELIKKVKSETETRVVTTYEMKCGDGAADAREMA